MKKIYNISILILALTLASCGEDFLSPDPISAVGAAGYFTTEGQLETGVINIYDGMQGVNTTGNNSNRAVQLEFYLAEMRSDNTRTKSSEGEAAQFENYTIEPSNGIIADYYRSMYAIIFKANTVLENLGVGGNSAGQFEGEAKFARAYAYFQLARLYGDVPLIDAVVGPLDIETQFTRRSTADIYNLIVSDLGTAVANLDNSYRTRASKAAAQALLAKVHLTLGNYSEARTMCEGVVGSGNYSLEANFKDVFYNEGNNETIFAIGYKSDDANDSQNFSAEWLNAVGRTTGVNYPTDEAVAALDAMGGNRAKYSYRVDKLQPIHHQVVKYLPDGDDDLGIAATSGNPTLAGNDFIVLRYADVLLMHVEAILGGSAQTNDGAALSSFNAVRARAGMPEAQLITKEDLLNERRVELAFENQRLFDLIRFGVAQNVLSEFATNNGFAFAATDLLLPIPDGEIGLSNGVLTQNPGY